MKHVNRSRCACANGARLFAALFMACAVLYSVGASAQGVTTAAVTGVKAV
jgi:hypothetical protein